MDTLSVYDSEVLRIPFLSHKSLVMIKQQHAVNSMLLFDQKASLLSLYKPENKREIFMLYFSIFLVVLLHMTFLFQFNFLTPDKLCSQYLLLLHLHQSAVLLCIERSL